VTGRFNHGDFAALIEAGGDSIVLSLCWNLTRRRCFKILGYCEMNHVDFIVNLVASLTLSDAEVVRFEVLENCTWLRVAQCSPPPT